VEIVRRDSRELFQQDSVIGNFAGNYYDKIGMIRNFAW